MQKDSQLHIFIPDPADVSVSIATFRPMPHASPCSDHSPISSNLSPCMSQICTETKVEKVFTFSAQDIYEYNARLSSDQMALMYKTCKLRTREAHITVHHKRRQYSSPQMSDTVKRSKWDGERVRCSLYVQNT